MSGVSWPDSISACRIASRRSSSERPPSRSPGSPHHGCPGETRLQQEIPQLVEQRLQVDLIGHPGDVLGVGGEAHANDASRRRS